MDLHTHEQLGGESKYFAFPYINNMTVNLTKIVEIVVAHLVRNDILLYLTKVLTKQR